MSDLSILISLLGGMAVGYLLGWIRRANEFDALQFELLKTKNQLHVLQRLFSTKESK